MILYAELPDHLHSIDDIVYMRVTAQYRNVGNINTVGQEFDGKLWIQIKWMVDVPYANVNLDTEWKPHLEVMNSHGKL